MRRKYGWLYFYSMLSQGFLDDGEDVDWSPLARFI